MIKSEKYQLFEIALEVSLIAMLVYFHVQEGKQHKEMMDAINGIKK